MPIQGGFFLFNSGGFLDSVLDGIIFVRYCTFILCGLMNTDEVRVIQTKHSFRFLNVFQESWNFQNKMSSQEKNLFSNVYF